MQVWSCSVSTVNAFYAWPWPNYPSPKSHDFLGVDVAEKFNNIQLVYVPSDVLSVPLYAIMLKLLESLATEHQL